MAKLLEIERLDKAEPLFFALKLFSISLINIKII